MNYSSTFFSVVDLDVVDLVAAEAGEDVIGMIEVVVVAVGITGMTTYLDRLNLRIDYLSLISWAHLRTIKGRGLEGIDNDKAPSLNLLHRK